MADQYQGVVLKDSLQELQLRSLYNMGGMRFVIPEPLVQGSYGVVSVPENEITPATQSALVLSISSNGEKVEKKLLGGKGSSNYSEKFEVGGLEFSLRYGSKVYELPFRIKLNDFIAEKYPGTEKSYASFMSKVTVEDERPFDYDIFMNHILDHKGYRFFQASFDPDERGTVLSVNHDFWGTWITYLGYFLLYTGLMGIMFFGKTRFKELTQTLDKLKKQKAAASIIMVFAVLSLNAQGKTQAGGHNHQNKPSQQQLDSLLIAATVSKEHAAKFGELVIQDDGGRMKPLNSFSSELLRKLSFKDSYKDLNADQVFLSMMLNPALWYNTEFIALDKKGQNDSLRSIIGVESSKRYVKATDFFDTKGAYKLAP
jgi:hypothetical protein